MARQTGLHFARRKKKIGSAIFREVVSYVLGIGIAVLLAVVLTYFLGMSTKVIGESMEPSLYNGQTIYIDRFSYMLGNPEAGDVIVFLPNGNENSYYYVKRVIAGPGDRVQIENSICYVNGEVSRYAGNNISEAGIAGNEFVLDVGTYFCMGDDPDNSEDSRSPNIGPVKDRDILGRAWFHAGCDEDGWGFVQ